MSKKPIILFLDDDPEPHEKFDEVLGRISDALGYDPKVMLEHVVHCTRSAQVFGAAHDPHNRIVACFSDNELDSTSTKERIFQSIKEQHPDAVLVWASRRGPRIAGAESTLHETVGRYLTVLKGIFEQFDSLGKDTEKIRRAYAEVKDNDPSSFIFPPIGYLDRDPQTDKSGMTLMFEQLIYAIGKSCEQIAHYRAQGLPTGAASHVHVNFPKPHLGTP